MASAVDISNLALGHVGDAANVTAISPPDGSAQAKQCAKFYPIARDALLAIHGWGFATRRIVLAEVDNTLDSWAFAYSLPNAHIRVLAVLNPESTDDTDTEDFIIESDDDGNEVLYTNVEDATLLYVVRVADTTKFKPLFVTALSWLLASYLAGPILKGKTGIAEAKRCEQRFFAELAKAKESDANARKVDRAYRNYVPAGIKARA